MLRRDCVGKSTTLGCVSVLIGANAIFKTLSSVKQKKLLGVDFFSPAHYTEMEFSVILPAVAEFYVPYNGRFSKTM